MRFAVGDHVHVAQFGKGVVREVRNGERYLVDIKTTSMVVAGAQLSAVEQRKSSRRASAAPVASSVIDSPSRSSSASMSIDLHGRTMAEAEEAVDDFLNEALLAGVPEVRIIHGRSGGRVKAAVHARLEQLPSVRGYRLDPANAGVTIVNL